MGKHEDTVHLLAGKKKCKDEYKDPDMLPKVNKAALTALMVFIKEYLISCYGIRRTSLAYIIRKTIIVQTYGDYPKYATTNDKMIIRMVHLP